MSTHPSEGTADPSTTSSLGTTGSTDQTSFYLALGVDPKGKCLKSPNEQVVVENSNGITSVQVCSQCSSSKEELQKNLLWHLKSRLFSEPKSLEEAGKIWEQTVEPALLRHAQVQGWERIEAKLEVERLQSQVQELESLKKNHENQIATLQAKVEKQERMISHELKMIKSIAKKRADHRKNSIRSNNSNANSNSNGLTPSSNDSPGIEAEAEEMEAPPRLPGRKLSGTVLKNYRPSEISDITTSGFTNMQSLQSRNSEAFVPSIPLTASASSGTVSDENPKIPIRQTSQSVVSTNEAANVTSPSIKVISKAAAADKETRVISSGSTTPPATRGAPTQTILHQPPPLPQRQASQDTGFSTASSDLTFTEMSSYQATSLVSSGDDTLTQDDTDGGKVQTRSSSYDSLTVTNQPSPANSTKNKNTNTNSGSRRQLYQSRNIMLSQSTGSDVFATSELTLDTLSDEVIYKPPEPTAQNSLSSMPYAIAEEEEPDSSRHSIQYNLQQEFQPPPPPPPPDTSMPPPPPPAGTPGSIASKSIAVPGFHDNSESHKEIKFDAPASKDNSESHKEIKFDAPASKDTGGEIRFDASAAFDHWNSKQAVRRVSIADTKFGASDQLLMEASQALSTAAMPTPNSVRLRKSLTKGSSNLKPRSAKRGSGSSSGGQEEQEIVLSPEIISKGLIKAQADVDIPAPGVSSSTHAARTTYNQSREIELQAPIRKSTKQMAQSLLERHLEGPTKGTNLGESMHNKTEEQILQEKIFGKAVTASQEDEEDDEYDYFAESVPVSKGYLEYNRSINLSPVSALTTGSYLREMAHQQAIGPLSLEEENEDIGGPRKALHNAGFAKRLPLEDGFDSDDDDDDDNSVQQDEVGSTEKGDAASDEAEEINSEDEKPNSPKEEVPEKVRPPRERRDTHARHEERQAVIPLTFNLAPPAQQKSAHPKETPVVLSPKASRPESHHSRRNDSRTAKPTIHVSGETVQDKYGDGGIYTGTIAADSRLPHGRGNMRYDNERQYDGEWKGGRWHGIGQWVNPNGDCYQGTFVYDARHGSGTYTWKNGNVYSGDFHEDKRQGRGVFNFANGNVYEGDFINGVFEGQGEYKFDGGFYQGEWKSGRYHGNGKLLFEDGSSYQGEFLDGVAHGNGTETASDGKERRGIWENGRPQMEEE